VVAYPGVGVGCNSLLFELGAIRPYAANEKEFRILDQNHFRSTQAAGPVSWHIENLGHIVSMLIVEDKIKVSNAPCEGLQAAGFEIS
jgi:hypothetical protein